MLLNSNNNKNFNIIINLLLKFFQFLFFNFNFSILFNLFSFNLIQLTTTINSSSPNFSPIVFPPPPPPPQNFLSSNCGFHSKNYTIKWAYEPKTRNVVFVMKTKLPPINTREKNISFDSKQQKTQKMLTGIAFGDKDQLDFIGISSINDQLDLVSGHGEWQLRQEDVGHTFFDGENKKNRPPLIRMRGPLHVIINNTGGENGHNNQSGALPIRAISLKKQPTDGSVIAEFARLLAGDGEQLKTDLSKCTNFFLITRWISYNTSDENEGNSGNNGELPSILTTSSVSVRRTVCALVDECTLDTNQIIEQQLNEKKMKDLPPAASSPELAQSVDVSGKGDPCRFTGPTYSIEWWIEVNEKEEEIVNFLMKQKARKGRWWSAIGIGDNMSDMDIGTIFLENGEPKAMIDYFSNSYNLPVKDTKQDWKLNKKLSKWPKKLFVEDNNSEDEQIVELYFSRKITTEDENDRSMDDCVLFQFGANLGIYGPPGFRLHKHQDWPDLYKACKLKNHCMRHKRQNGRNDRNNFVNIPTLSHSIDENQTNNSINVTDKAIELLMKSLGPKIVQTVSESDKNETENTKVKTKLIQKTGQKEEINEEDNNEIIKGKATIIPLLINSKQQSNNGMQISEGNDVGNEKKNENKQNENNKTSIIISKRLSTSPFSLSAFLGGGEQQQQPLQQQLNLNNETVNNLGENGNSSTASVIRQSGEGGVSAENGGLPLEGATNVTLPSPPRFGISQMLQEENEISNSSSSSSTTTLSTTNNLNETNLSTTISQENISNTSNEIQTTIIPTNISNNEAESPTTISTTQTTNNTDEHPQTTIVITTSEQQTNISSTNIITPTELSGNSLFPENETNNLNSSSQQQNSETFTSTTILPTTVEIQQSTSLNNKIEETLENSTTAILTNSPTTLTVNLESTNTTTLINNETSTGESNISTNTTAEITTQPTTIISTEKTNKPTNVYLTTKTTTEKHQMETSNTKNISTNSPETTKTTLNKTNFSNLPGSNEQPEERGIKLPIATSKCDALRPDLPICRSYMDTYIERVKDWSERHGEPLERQFPKACRLLNSVPHVPTLCCQLFNDRCNDFI
ncbi:unnamed protein product [Meloidogyne enterolobii]|uniref:Uncharacterized protein n=1 Tax=Meloidogyne enterolobii TaxID=390850 RepID=A0ACB0XR47_MELEN